MCYIFQMSWYTNNYKSQIVWASDPIRETDLGNNTKSPSEPEKQTKAKQTTKRKTKPKTPVVDKKKKKTVGDKKKKKKSVTSDNFF